MTRTEKKANIRAASAKLQELKQSELDLISGAINDCCITHSYKTGNYRKTTVGFITLAEYEYFCMMCEQFFWQGEIEYFN